MTEPAYKARQLSVDEWLEAFKRRTARCGYVGSGVAGLLVVGGLADKLFGAVSPFFRVGFIVVTLFAGVLVAFCTIAYEVAIRELAERKGSNDGIAGDTILRGDAPNIGYPQSGPPLFNAAILMLAVAATIMVVASIVGAVHPSKHDRCFIQWDFKENKAICVDADG